MKTVKEINTEIMQLDIMRQGDRIPGVLREWAASIVNTVISYDWTETTVGEGKSQIQEIMNQL